MEQLFTHVSPVINSALILLVGVYLIYERFRSGSSNLRKEIAEEYKERNKQLEEKLKDFQKQINETNILVAELKGTIKEKDNTIEILKDRNPETLSILKETKDLNIQIVNLLKNLHERFGLSQKELAYQTQILEKGQKRSKKIDIASVKHKGDIMRIPPEVAKEIKEEK